MTKQQFQAKQDIFLALLQCILDLFESAMSVDLDSEDDLQNIKDECYVDAGNDNPTFVEDVKAIVTALQNDDIKIILIGMEMSADHIGGDDVISHVDSTLKAMQEGYPHILTAMGEPTVIVVEDEEVFGLLLPTYHLHDYVHLINEWEKNVKELNEDGGEED